MELQRYISIFWKWLWLIVLGTVVAAGSTLIYDLFTPPLYQSKTTVMVGQIIQDPNPANTDFWAGQQLAQTYAELVTREMILGAAVEALGAPMSWQALGRRGG